MKHFLEHYGVVVVFVVVFAEVAGLPFVPGETALITAAVLAHQGELNVVAVIAVAAAAAILGALAGFAIGLWRGERLLSLWPWLERLTGEGIRRSRAFFERHGTKTVFIARFLPVLRATMGWMAAVSGMPLRPFLVWNVAGGVTWAVAIGLASYYVGGAVVQAVAKDTAYGIAAVAALALLLLGLHFLRRRLEREL